tara:strand:- start:11128 stop:11919 length:792 start_codon:yes stop_codon:yes gene_type:complete
VVNEAAPISQSNMNAPDDDLENVEDTFTLEEEDSAEVLEPEYATKEELEKIRPMLGRATSALDQLQNRTNSMASQEDLTSIREELNQLRSLMELGLKDFASEDVMTELNNQRTALEKAADREALRSELMQELGQSPDTNVNSGAIDDTSLQAASNQVLAYARGKGVDPNLLPADVWNMQPGQTLDDAVRAAETAVDNMASEDTSTARRSKRKNADPQNGNSPSRAGGSTSYRGLNLEKLSKMTQDEISAIPKEVVDKVLTQGT